MHNYPDVVQMERMEHSRSYENDTPMKAEEDVGLKEVANEKHSMVSIPGMVGKEFMKCLKRTRRFRVPAVRRIYMRKHKEIVPEMVMRKAFPSLIWVLPNGRQIHKVKPVNQHSNPSCSMYHVQLRQWEKNKSSQAKSSS
ncbi:uncharacterized protein LOC130815325 isoform X1 [Amaranthus tricolor]|uniref:uncharacterized protein LOC130815325 isoform X1 n=2 Tax=Amaranthus tricolor TaxID=29722 RepID=UPI002584E847|nr:uncharacterized protein LOC130815325 isoform X1 [Amaranthus tricolor]